MKRKLKLSKMAKCSLITAGYALTAGLTGFPLNVVVGIDNALNRDEIVAYENTSNNLFSDMDLNRLLDTLEYSFYPTLPTDVTLSDWAKSSYDVFTGKLPYTQTQQDWTNGEPLTSDVNYVDTFSSKLHDMDPLSDMHSQWYLARGESMKYFIDNNNFNDIKVDAFLADEESKQVAIALSDSSGNAVVAFHGISGTTTFDDIAGVLYEAVNKKQKAGMKFTQECIENFGYNSVTLTGYSGGGAVAQYVTINSKTPDKIKNCVTFNPKGQSWLYMLKESDKIRKYGGKIRNIENEKDIVHLIVPQVGEEHIVKTNFPELPFWNGNLCDQHLITSMRDKSTEYRTIMPETNKDDPAAAACMNAAKILPAGLSTTGLLLALKKRKKITKTDNQELGKIK